MVNSDIPLYRVNSISTRVTQGFLGRSGGVSTGIYASLNCGPGSRDNPEYVAENRMRATRSLFGAEVPLLTPNQVHSPTCVYVQEPFTGARPEADALVTDTPGLLIGILTADCGPVLFEGSKPDGSPVVGAAHAGWGGALRGVLESTVDQMQKASADLSSIRAVVGPCITVRSYEVSEGFEAPFIAHNPESERFFTQARKPGHLMFDLPGYIAARLAGCGVRSVRLTDLDTYSNEDSYFSYRRATHRGEADYGRQLSAIGIF